MMIDAGLSRRRFLVGSLSLALASTSGTVFSQWLMDEKSNFRKKYEFNPNDWMQEEQIENEVLPENHPKDFWDMPRRLELYRPHTSEFSSLVYHQDGRIQAEGFWTASYLMRDVRAGKMQWIDPRLLDLLCAMQFWLKAYGVGHVISIHSGYRTRATNELIEGSAKESFHLHGRAIDFSIPGVPAQLAAAIAAHFQAGGIGLYLGKKFTHLDTGGVRSWVKR